MPFISQVTPDVGDATRQEDVATIINNVNFINAQLDTATGGILSIINGSFELVDGDGFPLAWVPSVASGKTLASASGTTDTRHGLRAIKMENASSSTGDVSLTSESFINIGPQIPLSIGWYMKSSFSGVTNSVDMSFYDNDESLVSTSGLYVGLSGTAPTDWVWQSRVVIPPTTGRLAKLIIKGVTSSTNGETFYDGFQASYAPSSEVQWFSGNGTYVVPPGASKLHARLWAGGGGAGGGVVGVGFGSNATAGGNGGDTWVKSSTFKARGGLGGGGAFSTNTPGGAPAGLLPQASGTYIQHGTRRANPGQAGVGSGAGSGGAGGDGSDAIGRGGNGTGAAKGSQTFGGHGEANTGHGAGGASGGNSGSGGGAGGAGGQGGEYAEYTFPVSPGDLIPVEIGGQGVGGVGGDGFGLNGGYGGTGFAILEAKPL